MKIPCLLIAAALVVPVSGYAQASKPCEELKSEIAKKMDANGVKSYSLDIVDKEKDAQGKVVGTDNLFHTERIRTTARYTVVNLTNQASLYNFLSPFGGTHWLSPRTHQIQLGLNF